MAEIVLDEVSKVYPDGTPPCPTSTWTSRTVNSSSWSDPPAVAKRPRSA